MCGSLVRIQVGSPRDVPGPHRLAWPRTPPFHGGDGGSNPPGDAIFLFSSLYLKQSHHVDFLSIYRIFSVVKFSLENSFEACDNIILVIKLSFRVDGIWKGVSVDGKKYFI